MRILVIILLCLCISCATARKVDKEQVDTSTTTSTQESGTVLSKRAGDTLEIQVPNIVYKDTTIVRRGKTSTLYTSYDGQGNASIKAICDEINELKSYVRDTFEEKDESIVSKDTEREGWFQPIMILWGFLGMIFFVFAIKLMNKFL